MPSTERLRVSLTSSALKGIDAAIGDDGVRSEKLTEKGNACLPLHAARCLRTLAPTIGMQLLRSVLGDACFELPEWVLVQRVGQRVLPLGGNANLLAHFTARCDGGAAFVPRLCFAAHGVELRSALS